MWSKFISTMLILVVSGLPVLVLYLQKSLDFVAPETPANQIEFYTEMTPVILYFGITLALMSLSESTSIHEHYLKSRYYSGLFSNKILPFIVFLLIVFLAMNLLIYYQALIHASKIKVSIEGEDLTAAAERMKLLGVCGVWSSLTTGNLYIIHQLLSHDISVNEDLFGE